jgi:hypothetical protein
MSNLIAEKPNRIMSIQQEPLKLKTAYDYLNRLSFTINGICNKTVELLLGDAVCLVGDSDDKSNIDKSRSSFINAKEIWRLW